MVKKVHDLALSRTFRIVDGGVEEDVEAQQNADSAQSTIAPGTVLDNKYEIVALIGSGGMGAVYKARHLQLNRDVALKTFLSSDLSMENWQRFQREAQAIAKLDDANIVKVFDFGVGNNNAPFYTMELLSGQSLADKLNGSVPVSRDKTLTYFRAVASGLNHAHKQKMVHRDIKPANIFICDPPAPGGKEAIKLVDFGIAKLISGGSSTDQSLTGSGTIFGSPLYMSPEQSLGETVDERSDIYSYGCSLFEALTGQVPFYGANALATMIMHQQRRPPKLAEKYPEGNFEQRLETTVARMLAKNPADRYQSFEEVLAVLDTLTTTGLKSGEDKAPHTVPKIIQERQGQSQNSDSIAEAIIARSGGWSPGVIAAIFLILVLSFGTIYVAWSLLYKKQMTSSAVVRARAQAQSLTPSPSAAPAAAPVPAAEFGQPSYFRGYTKSGSRIYMFPEKILLGQLSYFGAPRYDVLARGRIVVPKNVNLRLDVDPEVEAHPNWLEGFGPNDIRAIQFEYTTTFPVENYHQIGRMTGLLAVRVKAAKLQPQFYDALNRLPLLQYLELGECITSADDILKLKRLNQMLVLNLDSVGHLSKVVDVIQHSKTINDLDLANGNLDLEDIKKVSRMPAVIHLKVGQNNVSNEGLGHLAKMPKLTSLDLEGDRPDPSCIAVLKTMKLLHLKINTEAWSDADVKKLRDSLPQCEVKPTGMSPYKVF